MSRLIDADELKLVSYDIKGTAYDGAEYLAYVAGIERVFSDIDDAPTIDPESLRSHGHWKDFPLVRKINKTNVPIVQCSNCKITFCDIINNHHYIYHYCPYCGAKMEGVEEP